LASAANEADGSGVGIGFALASALTWLVQRRIELQFGLDLGHQRKLRWRGC
jgi:hypothetical protein